MREKGRTAFNKTLRLSGSSFAKIDNAVRQAVAAGFKRVPVAADLLDKFIKAAPFLSEGRIQVA